MYTYIHNTLYIYNIYTMYILYIDTIYVYIYTHKHTYAHIPSRSMVFPSGIKEYMYVCICTDRYISKYINIYEIYILGSQISNKEIVGKHEN